MHNNNLLTNLRYKLHVFILFRPSNNIKFILGDGLIQEKELQHVMRACMDENGMRFDEGEVDDLTRALFQVMK